MTPHTFSIVDRCLLRAVPLAAALTLTQAHGQPSLEGTPAEPIFEQLEAFRLYAMVQEGGAWKINGVVARPDPGEEA